MQKWACAFFFSKRVPPSLFLLFFLVYFLLIITSDYLYKHGHKRRAWRVKELKLLRYAAQAIVAPLDFFFFAQLFFCCVSKHIQKWSHYYENGARGEKRGLIIFW